MRETKWTGRHGCVITIRAGSTMPPQWALDLIERVLVNRGRFSMQVRWTNSTRGGRGMCFGPHFISIGAAPGDDRTRYVVIHELAHALNTKRDRHGDGFYDQLVRIATYERSLRLVTREHTKWHARAPLTRAVKRAKENALVLSNGHYDHLASYCPVGEGHREKCRKG